MTPATRRRQPEALRRALCGLLAAGPGVGAPWSLVGAAEVEPPRPGPPRPLEIDAPAEFRLANGLRVVLAERRGVQLATVSLVVLAGSETDPPGRAGLASLTAELLTKGTRRRDASRIAVDAESLGGLLDGDAGWHQSSVGITVAVPRLDTALALVAEVVREPTFAPDELARLRAQSLDELRVVYSRPDRLAALATRRLLYGDGPYGHPSSGTPASLAALTRADVIRQHAAHFRPDRAVLVLAGDLDVPAARTLADRHFADWRHGPSTLAPRAHAAHAEPAPETLVVDLPPAGQAAVVVALPLPPLGADRATAEVLNAVLGGGFSARLNQSIRIRRGLSYGAGSGLDDLPLGGSLRATVQTRNESAAEVVALVQAELDRLAREPVDAAELAARKATLVGDFGRSLQTTAGLAAALQARVVAGLPVASLGARLAELAAVDADTVRRYAALHLGAGRRRVVVAGDAARVAPALRREAPALRVVPAARIAAGASLPG